MATLGLTRMLNDKINIDAALSSKSHGFVSSSWSSLDHSHACAEVMPSLPSPLESDDYNVMPHRSYVGGDAKYDERLLRHAIDRRKRVSMICRALEDQLSKLEEHIEPAEASALSADDCWASEDLERLRTCSFAELLQFRLSGFVKGFNTSVWLYL